MAPGTAGRFTDRHSEKSPIIVDDERKRNVLQRFSDRIPARYAFALLGFLGMMNVYAMRVNLSVAMVVMVNSSAIPHEGTLTNECHSNETTVNIGDEFPIDAEHEGGEFAWNEKTQGIILGSFFWGYIVSQLPGGRLAETFSGKWLFGFGILCTAIMTILTPIAARLGVGYFVAVRIIEGLGEGVTFPAMHVMLSKWSPPLERSKISTFVYTGCQFGTVVALPLSGYLCQLGNDGGWPNVFYVFGALGTIWFAAWAALAHENPFQHPRISKDELHYILDSQNLGTTKAISSFIKSGKYSIVPWRQLLTSMPVWAIVIAHFGHNWGFYTLLTEMPTYMKNILGFNIQQGALIIWLQNSMLSALPYLGMWLFGLLTSYVADGLRSMDLLSTATVRKLANLIGTIGPALGLLAVMYAGCDPWLSLLCLTMAVTLNAAIYSGFQSNHIDIAPRFAGTLIGFTNTFATIPGIAAPYIVGILTQNQQTLHQWSIVFFIACALYVFVAIFYSIFASGEEQLWSRVYISNDIEDHDEERNLNETSSFSDKDE